MEVIIIVVGSLIVPGAIIAFLVWFQGRAKTNRVESQKLVETLEDLVSLKDQTIKVLREEKQEG